MMHTQSTMKRLRTTQWHIYQDYFTAAEREKYQLWSKVSGFWYTPSFIVGLIVANILAVAAAIYVILRVPYLLAATGG